MEADSILLSTKLFISVLLWFPISSAYIFISYLCSTNDVEHSWEHYIYSAPTLYGAVEPFAISTVTSVLPFHRLHRFCSIKWQSHIISTTTTLKCVKIVKKTFSGLVNFSLCHTNCILISFRAALICSINYA